MVAINQDIRAYSGDSSLVMNELFFYFITGFSQTLLPIITKAGATVESIESGYIEKLPFPLPPLEEQRRIVAYLDAETAKLDRLTAKAGHAVRLLQEHRSSLISAAVTGRIDVRGA